MKMKHWMVAATLAPVLAACGGDGDPPPAPVVRLCPQTIDYNTVFIGGSGSGELVKVQLDTTKMTYRLTYLASPIPVTTGTVQPTREAAPANVVDGTLADETGLPTIKLNQCTFRMQNASLDPNQPARLFLGEGVLGGTIPGAAIQFDGVIGVGQIPKTTFPYYPFISFSSLETDISKVAGTYNQLGYHQVPSQNFTPVAVDQQVTINVDGSYAETDNFGKKNGGQPLASSATVNQPFTLRPDAPAFQSLNYQPQVAPTLAAHDPAKAGKGILIVGKMRNQLVPILIRTGAANAELKQGAPSADDESGISILSPQTAIAQGSQDGEYTGVDSAFGYRATALIGTQATLLDPFQASQAALARQLSLDYMQKVPGVVTSVHTDAASGSATGKFIFTGGVYGFLDMSDTANPYFTIGAFVQ
ncbi:DUF2957 domain-containing protein [Burkholderia cenocepacia]|uniref:DUF2957 domain-containing protein n=1 Tax=Burkholderia cenocepacia TaxID=95486 RepID=UPI00075ADD35|nr:DUF2957 domain-containing protein [Burkholderia cenocepacia]AOK38728.1 hypothetical protein WL90_31200 [Burkholderia cenocepacia]KWF71088.1 hypothetical protein WL89_04655 [Burkholderia cenocepacia]